MTDPEKCRACVDLVRHERELRESAALIIDERFRAQAQALVLAEKALHEKLAQMNAFRDENRLQASQMISREAFEAHIRTSEVRREGQEQIILTIQRSLDKITTTVSTLRALVAIVGTPGVLVMLWALIAAATNKTVTGPGGIIP